MRPNNPTSGPRRSNPPRPVPADAGADARWRFLRDVAVFEFKMVLDNIRDFLLIPASLVVALLDLVFRGEREGERFYRLLKWGRHSESMIDVYSCIEDSDEPPAFDEQTLKQTYSVDAVVARLEGVIAREVERGGTAATVKQAVDKAIDQIQHGAGTRRDQAQARVLAAAGKIKSRFEARGSDPSDSLPPPSPPPPD